MTYTPQGQRDQPFSKTAEPPQLEPKKSLRLEWILGPLALLGMTYVLQNTSSVVTWDHVMDLLHVKNRERYTMLFHLGLTVIFIVAAVRILGRKDKE